MVAAVRADTLDLVELLVEQHLLARRALRPEVGRVGVAAGPERRQLDRHVSRVAQRGRRPALLRRPRPPHGPSRSPRGPGPRAPRPPPPPRGGTPPTPRARPSRNTRRG